MSRFSIKAIACWLAFAVSTLAAVDSGAQDRPLISSLNGSIGAFAGWTRTPSAGNLFLINDFNYVPPFDCDTANNCFVQGSQGDRINGFGFGGEARISVPLGQNFGVQADSTFGMTNAEFVGTVRGHAFVGASTYGTIGPLVQYTAFNNASFIRAGGEAQAWLGPFSLYGSGGYQWADQTRYVKVNSGAFVCAEARWYVVDNAMIGVGGDWTSTRAAGFANAEFQLSGSLQPMSLYARGGIGEDRYRSVIAGFRWQIGAGPTLMARHRQDLVLPYSSCGEEQFSTRRITNVTIAVE